MGHLDKLLGVGVLMLGLMVLIGFMTIDSHSYGREAQTIGEDSLTHLINNGNALRPSKVGGTAESMIVDQKVGQ